MRQQSVTLSAAGSSNWLWLDSRRLTEQEVSFIVSLDFGAVLTYDVEITRDRNSNDRWENIVVVGGGGGNAFVTHTDHGLKTGDNITTFDNAYVNHSPDSTLETTADITVTGVSAYNYPFSGGASSLSKIRVITFRVEDVPGFVGNTTEDSGNLSDVGPVSGIRLNITAYTSGSATLTVLQQG